MENYREYNDPVSRWIDRRLTRLVERRAEEYAQRYATRPDGSVDEPLADLIRYEVRRRGHMSMELDVYEPIRWTAISTVLSFAGGIALKRMMGETSIMKLAQTGAATGALGAAISLLRPYLRFDAALYGGAQTALGIYDDKFGLAQSPGQQYLQHMQPEGKHAADTTRWTERADYRKHTGQEKEDGPVR